MGTIKDRNGIDLTEAEAIRKRWQEYIELYKNDLHDPDNHDGVITHLEPDILECKAKWALGSISTKLVEVMKFIELFQILKDDAVKVLHSQFSSVTQWCLTLFNPMDCSTPGLPLHHQLPESTQTHVHWVGDAIQPSHPLSSPSSTCLQSFPASGSFQMSQLFTSGGQSIGVSASTSVLPMNTQDLSPLGWTG